MIGLEDIDSDELDGLIEAFLPLAINTVHITVMPYMLDDKHLTLGEAAQVKLNSRGVLSFHVDVPLLRLVAFKAEDSEVTVTEMVEEDSAAGAMQHNPYTRGGARKPYLVRLQGKTEAERTDFKYYCVGRKYDDPLKAIERFFDTLNQSYLIELLTHTIKDVRVISLIHRYLYAGVMVNVILQPTTEGTPHGGPLSPLLSTIVLNEMDKEIERRGHPFVRYVDDSLIFCKSLRGAERVRDGLTAIIEKRLHLRVNREKTEVGHVRGMKYLGYSFYTTGEG